MSRTGSMESLPTTGENEHGLGGSGSRQRGQYLSYTLKAASVADQNVKESGATDGATLCEFRPLLAAKGRHLLERDLLVLWAHDVIYPVLKDCYAV